MHIIHIHTYNAHMNIYAHIYMNTHIHTITHIYTHTCIYMYTHICIYMYTHASMFLHRLIFNKLITKEWMWMENSQRDSCDPKKYTYDPQSPGI